LSINEYIKEACIFLGEDFNSVIKKDRRSSIVKARYMVITYLYEYHNWTQDYISYYFSKNRTIVVHARSVVYNLCFIDPKIKKKYDGLTKHLNDLFNTKMIFLFFLISL
jgi:hypothetical protein